MDREKLGSAPVARLLLKFTRREGPLGKRNTMRMNHILLAGAAMFSATSAHAATFNLTGAHTASFALPLSPTAIDPEGQAAGLNDPTIFGLESVATVDGTTTPVLFHFYTDAGGGGFDLISLGATFFRYSPAGPSIFTGTVSSPTFVSGEYDFTDFDLPALSYHLSVTTDAVAAVPETATWAMMLAGFGMIGFAARRRKTPVRVTYA